MIITNTVVAGSAIVDDVVNVIEIGAGDIDNDIVDACAAAAEFQIVIVAIIGINIYIIQFVVFAVVVIKLFATNNAEQLPGTVWSLVTNSPTESCRRPFIVVFRQELQWLKIFQQKGKRDTKKNF